MLAAKGQRSLSLPRRPLPEASRRLARAPAPPTERELRVLADQHESRDRQALRARALGASVASAFVPKRDSELSAAGPSTMPRVSKLANTGEGGYCWRQTRLQMNVRMCTWASKTFLSDRDLAFRGGRGMPGWVEIVTLDVASAAHDAVRWHVFCHDGTRGHD